MVLRVNVQGGKAPPPPALMGPAIFKNSKVKFSEIDRPKCGPDRPGRTVRWRLRRFEILPRRRRHSGAHLWVGRITSTVLVVATCCSFTRGLSAQELSPRAFWPAPRGTKILSVGYSYSSGDTATDPTLPVVGLDSSLHTGLVGYLQTLSVFGRTANLLLEVPYTGGSTVGTLNGAPARRHLSGLGDLGITLSVNLLGAPSLNAEEFQALRATPRQILGASLRVQAPTGEYQADRVINVGANRWAGKAELGYIVPLHSRLLLELEGGAWWFGNNEDFLGVTRAQEPVYSGEVHVVARFRAGFWASLDSNFYTGGRNTIGDEPLAALQRNSNLGGTVVVPFAGRYALKVGYSTGVVTASGQDFDALLMSFHTLLP